MNKNLIFGILFASTVVLVGCTPTQRGVTTGAAAGAAIGALAGGSGNRGQGALIGGAVGGVAGGVVGSSQEQKYYGPQGY
tara:strand:- start:650 stop:889 length:240 start_codon:yes stop_codon:yes gene_type:complete